MAVWHWSKHYFKAMNTGIYVWLYSAAENSNEILQDVNSLFASMDRRLSRFNPYGELSQLNNTSGSFVASPTLFDAVEVAIWAAEATGGLFDPTILPNLEQAGYAGSFETVAQTGPSLNLSLPARPGRFRNITLNRTRSTIHKPAGIKVDLGGIGKGWTADRAADRLLGLGPFLVNAGGDLYAYGTPPGETGWRVVLPHPLDDDLLLATLRVANRTVATSSLARRQWQRGQRRLHHLIDPRTAQPAETDLLSVTVIGERVATAEVFAKVALIIGSRHGLNYLETIPDVEGLLVTTDGGVLQTSGLNHYFDRDNGQ